MSRGGGSPDTGAGWRTRGGLGCDHSGGAGAQIDQVVLCGFIQHLGDEIEKNNNTGDISDKRGVKEQSTTLLRL